MRIITVWPGVRRSTHRDKELVSALRDEVLVEQADDVPSDAALILFAVDGDE